MNHLGDRAAQDFPTRCRLNPPGAHTNPSVVVLVYALQPGLATEPQRIPGAWPRSANHCWHAAANAVRGGSAMSDACISFLLVGIVVLCEQLKELEPVAPPTPLPDDLRKPQQPLLLARLHPISFLQLPIPSPRVCHLCVEHDDWASGSDVGD